jgi:hypothetical protein
MTRKLRSITFYNDVSGTSIRVQYENYDANSERLGSDCFWIKNQEDLSIHDEKIHQLCNKFWELYQ